MPSGSSIYKPRDSNKRKTRSKLITILFISIIYVLIFLGNTSSDASTADVDDFVFPPELLVRAGSDASLLKKYFSKKNPPNFCTDAQRLIDSHRPNIHPCPGPQDVHLHDKDAISRPKSINVDPSLFTGISEKVILRFSRYEILKFL